LLEGLSVYPILFFKVMTENYSKWEMLSDIIQIIFYLIILAGFVYVWGTCGLAGKYTDMPSYCWFIR